MAPSQGRMARADPRLASSSEQARTGTSIRMMISAVPRAEPFMTAVPRRMPGSRNVTRALAAAVRASVPDSQNAALPGRSTEPEISCRAVCATPLDVAVAMAIHLKYMRCLTAASLAMLVARGQGG